MNTSYAESHPLYREIVLDELRLRAPRMDDAAVSLLWVKNSEIVQYMGADFSNPSLEDEEKRLRDIIASQDEYSWMIELDGKLIGNVNINSIEEISKKFSVKAGCIAVLIGSKEHWGKGIGTRVCSAIIDWAFSEGNFEMLTARALQENISSIKTLQKLNFQETGTEPYKELVNGKKTMWRNFQMDRTQWTKERV